MSKRVVVIGGGTMFYIRPHLALSAPAYGTTALDITRDCNAMFDTDDEEWEVDLYMTKMAGGSDLTYGPHVPVGGVIDTNADVSLLLDNVIADHDVKVVFMPVALCDFDVTSLSEKTMLGETLHEVGKQLPRLQTRGVESVSLNLKPADKIIGKIRQTRKDIFLVGFKTTTGFTVDQQFEAGLKLLKESSCNLVLANDLTTRTNMIVTPEQAKYAVTTDRAIAIETLVKMTAARCCGTFTRSTVENGSLVPWNSPEVPDSLRVVVNHAIERGAYRPFNGKTVGHFAVRVGENRYLTSVRKTNFNDLLSRPDSNGLVKVEAVGSDKIVAYGARPSVGGQSQRIIFNEHPDVDCIFHAHVQLKPGSKVPVASQWQHECGSHGCGHNTSTNLKKFDDGIYAVMLEKHGPNVVFNRNVDPQKVIKFIEDNFDLDHQTSELS